MTETTSQTEAIVIDFHADMDRNALDNTNKITSGVIWKQLLLFFFPILLGTFFQQLYNTVDAVIVGQYLGKEALAAVGGGTSIVISLLIGFFTGVASGAAVVISQFFGARNIEGTNKAIHTGIALSIVAGIVISLVGYFMTVPMLNLIATPEDVMPYATEYMKIYFTGAIWMTVYNMGSGIQRALGDSKKPFYFLIVGCGINIILDFVFVRGFGMGVDGAAWATVISQLVSAVLTIMSLRHAKGGINLSLRRLRIHKDYLMRTLRIGLPTGIQSVLYTISNLIIQTHINGFGTDTSAAWAAYTKLDQVFWMTISAFGIAVTTFIGQNYGAGLFKRVKNGAWTGIWMGAVITFMLMAFFLLIPTGGLILFTSDETVLEIGMRILYLLVPTWIIYMPIELLSGVARGVGKTLIPTIIIVLGICGFRITWLQIVPKIWQDIDAVFLSYPISWGISAIAMVIYMFAGKVLPKEQKSPAADGSNI